jgi:hypothetical protein
MGRPFGIPLLMLVAVIVLPTFAAVAQVAIPFLITWLAVFLIWRMAFPPRPGRR